MIITYKAPWVDPNIVEDRTVDMIFSQAVMEHVDDIAKAYGTMKRWLKPSGYISHQIDFKSHGTASSWDGHWTFGDFAWKLIRGNRLYGINRMPISAHTELLNKHGFDIHCLLTNKMESTISRDKLSSRFNWMSDEDMTIAGAFVQASVSHNHDSVLPL